MRQKECRNVLEMPRIFLDHDVRQANRFDLTKWKYSFSWHITNFSSSHNTSKNPKITVSLFCKTTFMPHWYLVSYYGNHHKQTRARTRCHCEGINGHRVGCGSMTVTPCQNHPKPACVEGISLTCFRTRNVHLTLFDVNNHIIAF